MIISKNALVGVILIVSLFTATFTTVSGIARLPDELLSGENIYVITRAGDPNPLRNEMSEAIAWAIENISFVEGVSPEIMIFTALGDEPVVVRGVYFQKFFRLEGGSVISGRMPAGPHEALMGVNLFRRTGASLNTTLLLPGGFKTTMAAVKVVGVFRTGGMADDELLISVPVGRALAGLRAGTVAYIRVMSHDYEKMSALLDPSFPKFYVKDLRYESPGHVGEVLNVTVRVENFASTGGTCHIRLHLGNLSVEREVELEPYEETTLDFLVVPTATGNFTVRAEIVDELFPHALYGYIDIVNRSLQIRTPMEVVVGQPFTVSVTDVEGNPVEGCLVGVGDAFNLTNASGEATLVLGVSGNLTGYAFREGYENRSFTLISYDYVPLENAVNITGALTQNLTVYGNHSVEVVFSTDFDLFYSMNMSGENTELPFPRTLNLSTLPEGTTTFVLRGWHGYNYTEGLITVVVDNTPPYVYAPHCSGRVMAGEVVAVEVSDNVGVYEASAVVFNDTYEETYYGRYINITTSGLNGNYSVMVRAADLAGNGIEVLFTMEVGEWNDTSPPYLASYTSEIGPDMPFVARLDDDFRVENYTAWIYRDGVLVKTVEGTGARVAVKMYDVSGDGVHYEPPGEYVAKIYYVDAGGVSNVSTVNFTLNYSMDLTPPYVFVERTWLGVGEPLNITLWDANEIPTATVSGADYEREGNRLVAIFDSPGTWEIEIFAADVYGNVAVKHVLISVFETEAVPEISWTAELHAPVYDNERWEIAIEAFNGGAVAGIKIIGILVDGEPIREINVTVEAGERAYIREGFDPLPAGRHVVEVTDGNSSMIWIVEVREKYLEKVPIDLLIKYGKDVELESRGGTVYKAIEISRGNFVVLISSVIFTTAILAVLGIESIVSRCYEDRKRNLAILRAIGATRWDIRRIVFREFVIYFLISTVLGILIGLGIFLAVTSSGALRAFGHTVTFSVSPGDVLLAAVVSLLISIITSYLTVQLPAARKTVAEIIDRGARGKEYVELEGVLNEI